MAHTTYGIDKYIYLCYNYFRQNSALERPFDANFTTAQGYINKVIAEEEALFKEKVGLSVDEFMKVISEQKKEIEDFNLLFNGLSAGGVIFSDNVTSDSYSDRVGEAAASVVTFAMGSARQGRKEITNFIKQLGQYNALDFGLLEILNKGSLEDSSVKGVTETLNLLFNNKMKVSINTSSGEVQAYLFYEMLQQFEDVVFNKILKEGANEKALSVLKNRYDFSLTNFSKDGKEMEKCLNAIDSVLERFKQYQSGTSKLRQAITQSDVKSLIHALTSIRRLMGANEEILTTLRAEGLAKIAAKMAEDQGMKINASMKKAMRPKNTGRTRKKGALEISVTANDDFAKSIDESLATVFTDRTYNKTADVTLTFPGGTSPVAISTKRYNITRAWSMTVSQRNYLQTLAFLREADPTIEELGTSQAMLNAFYFGYGQLSYMPDFEERVFKQYPRNLTRGTIDADHLKAITNLNLRMLVSFLSVNKQAFFDINGFFIPAPLYMRYALQKALKEEYQDGTNLSALNSVMVEMSAFQSSIRRILDSAPILEIENGAIPWSDFVRPRAYMRNTYTRSLIFSTKVRIQPRMLTMETYKAALGYGN